MGAAEMQAATDATVASVDRIASHMRFSRRVPSDDERGQAYLRAHLEMSRIFGFALVGEFEILDLRAREPVLLPDTRAVFERARQAAELTERSEEDARASAFAAIDRLKSITTTTLRSLPCPVPTANSSGPNS